MNGGHKHDGALEAKLKRALKGEVLFDGFSRGRYSTDASIYQIEPVGVAVPRDREDVAAALEIARGEGVALLPRGGGTSQCGQAVGRALVLDCSKYMNQVVASTLRRAACGSSPGWCWSGSTAASRRQGLFFPVDVSTSDRATIGGMTANNSCGARSLRYGNMVHNVRGIDALLPDGTAAVFGDVPGNFGDGQEGRATPERYRDLVRRMRELHRREAAEIDQRFPKLLRKVGGYNIDMIADAGSQHGASAGGIGRHPRLLQRDRIGFAADPAASRARHLPFPELPSGDGKRPRRSSS